MNRTPFAGGDSLPPVKRANEGVWVFVSQQIGCLVQFERGLAKVVLCHFPPRLLDQIVKRQPLFKQAPLQCPGTDPQFGRDIFQSRLLAGQESLEDFFRLLLQGPASQLLLQFCFQLRGYEFQQFRIVRYERLTDVLPAKEQPVASRAELHRALKMSLIKPPVCFGAPQLHTKRVEGAPCSTLADRNRPGKTHIDPCRRLCRFRQQPNKLNGAFLATLRNPDLLRRYQSFVAGDSLQCVAKRTAVERGDGNGAVALGPLLAAKFQPDTGIVADLMDGTVQRK